MDEDSDKFDNTWKKIVIEKVNNAVWIASSKRKKPIEDSSMNRNTFSLEQPQLPVSTVKVEYEEEEDSIYEPSQHEFEESAEKSAHPLLIPSCTQKRRRGSGPKSESHVQRAERLAKMSAYAAQRLANESPQQRATRLQRMSQYAAKRLAQESEEQRAKRLARMSAYAAERLARESPEQRQSRLARMSAYAAKRQALKKMASYSRPPDELNNQS